MRIGLIGCGRWGQLILRDLQQLGTDVSVVVPAGAQFAVSVPNVPTFAAIGDLPEVDGIIIATPTSTHAAVAYDLMDRGVPIFCEKPLTDDLKAATRLAKRALGRLFVMDKWRYHNGVLALAQVARSGVLGKVTGLKTRRLGFGSPQRDVDAAWNLLSHDLSISMEILGAPCQVTGAWGEFGEGRLQALTTLSIGSAFHFSEISVRSPVHERSIQLLCTGGTAFLPDSDSDHVVLSFNPLNLEYPESPRIERVQISTDMPLLAELRAFVEYLGGGQPPKSSAEEGVAIVEAIDQARRLAGATIGSHV